MSAQELRLPRRRGGQHSTQTSKNLIEAVRILARIYAVRMLARIYSDDLLASPLNRNGPLTARGNRWTRERGGDCFGRERRGIRIVVEYAGHDVPTSASAAERATAFPLIATCVLCSVWAIMKKLLLGILLLGWIPTLAIAMGGHWIAGVPVFGQARTPIKITRIFTGPDGKTKLEEFEVPLKSQGRGTELSELVPVTSVQFRRTNQDYSLDWHPAPRRQFVVTLAGESEIELDGGRKVRLGPGNILLAEDTTGQGHAGSGLAGRERISLIIPLAEGAKVPR
jgi:hypothetical protein